MGKRGDGKVCSSIIHLTQEEKTKEAEMGVVVSLLLAQPQNSLLTTPTPPRPPLKATFPPTICCHCSVVTTA